MNRIWRAGALLAVGVSTIAGFTVLPAARAADTTLDAVDHDPQPVSRLSFGSCAKEDQPQPIWSAVQATRPEVWVWAGDNVYNDTEDLAEIERKWATLSAIPGYAKVRDAARAVLGTWDDHDYGRNDAGAEYPMRAESQQRFLDFLGVDASSPRRQREGVYHTMTFGPVGQRLQVILLDTRYHRSALDEYPRGADGRFVRYRPRNDRDATFLGEAQWQWLERRLREPAEFRLIVSSIQFVADEHRFEKWANLSRERSRMLRLIDETGAEGVVFLTGDRHHAELSRLVRPGKYPIYDLTASGLNASLPRPDGHTRPLEINPHRVGSHFRGHHFGLVTIDWAQADPSLRLEIHDQQNRTPVHHTVWLSELRYPNRAVTVDTAEADSPAKPVTLTVDGDHTDWPDERLVAADDEHVYLRFHTPDLRTLRRHGESIIIGINGDANRDTGKSDATRWGIDLELEFGLPDEDVEQVWRSTAPRVRAFNGAAAQTDFAPGDIDLHAQPTYASRHFEVRLDRDAPAAQRAGLAEGGPVEVTVTGRDLATGRQRVLLRGRSVIPPIGRGQAETPPQIIPDKPDGAVRFVVWNVLWEQPQENPEPFSRIFRALDGDIALLQEWDRRRYREDDIEAWFTDHVDAAAVWDSMVTGSGGRGSGTAVVTRHPIAAKLPPHSPVEADRWDFPARFAAAVVDTPVGRVLATSVHFKAGGFLGHPTDVRRRAEAEAVNRLVTGMHAASAPDIVVLGGDYNMNGTTDLVHLATRGLDADRSPLTLAHPTQLGDPGLVYTFGRGDEKRRLDYLAYSDTTVKVVNAFVLDTQRMLPDALAAAGLYADDAHASDHFPVVVDLIPTRVSPRTKQSAPTATADADPRAATAPGPVTP